MWSQSNPREELLNLLDEERDLVVAARYEALSSLAKKRDALAKKCFSARLSALDLKLLREKSERNRRLLSVAADACRDISKRLHPDERPTPAFQSYTSTGQHRSVGANTRNISKRL